MDSLEQEIIEKFQQLDSDAQARVRDFIQHTTIIHPKPPFDAEAWFAQMEEIRAQIAFNKTKPMPSAVDLVNEVREERDAEILHSLGFRDSAGDSAG